MPFQAKTRDAIHPNQLALGNSDEFSGQFRRKSHPNRVDHSLKDEFLPCKLNFKGDKSSEEIDLNLDRMTFPGMQTMSEAMTL